MLYTIGTSNRSLSAFIEPLLRLGVSAAYDVRSKPFSRFSHFNRPKLEASLSAVGIDYHWRGEVLGGLNPPPPDSAPVQAALEELVEGLDDNSAVIFCAEGEPSQCHRSWTIGRALMERYGVVVVNILRNDEREDMDVTLSRIPRIRRAGETA